MLYVDVRSLQVGVEQALRYPGPGLAAILPVPLLEPDKPPVPIGDSMKKG
jgi:hypothetical protein